MVNRRGWLRLVEAVVSIVIVLTTVIVVIVNSNIGKEQSGLCSTINPYLEEIAQNQTQREMILTQNESNVNGNLTLYLKDKISDPALDYKIKVCSLEGECLLNEGGLDNIEICAGERVISNFKGQTSDLAPRKIKLFLFRR
ncbi:MAG: hypothetical protein AABX11_00770 [Nanoarchaeota archaeon]